jgi:hydrogenase maturation protease
MDVVIGVGNGLRRDDGIGQEIARALSPSPGLEVWTVQGLVPELALRLQGAKRVLFVDADAATTEVRLVRVAPSTHGGGHDLGPEGLLALTGEVSGAPPEAWVLSVPGFDFGHGEGLSDRAAAFLPRAREAASRWLAGKELARHGDEA